MHIYSRLTVTHKCLITTNKSLSCQKLSKINQLFPNIQQRVVTKHIYKQAGGRSTTIWMVAVRAVMSEKMYFHKLTGVKL
jgi:hypothetical protein